MSQMSQMLSGTLGPTTMSFHFHDIKRWVDGGVGLAPRVDDDPWRPTARIMSTM